MRPQRETLGLFSMARMLLAVYAALLIGGFAGTLLRAAYFSDATQMGALYVLAFFAAFAAFVYVGVKHDV